MSRFIGVSTLKTNLHDVLKSKKPLAHYVIIVFCLVKSTRVCTTTPAYVRFTFLSNAVEIKPCYDFCFSTQCFARFRSQCIHFIEYRIKTQHVRRRLL